MPTVTDPSSADDLEPAPAEDAYDDQGVDRSQIRAFLALTPAERLDRLHEMVAFIEHVRRLNASR